MAKQEISNQEAEQDIYHILSIIHQNWERLATDLGILRDSINHMRPAFLLADKI